MAGRSQSGGGICAFKDKQSLTGSQEQESEPFARWPADLADEMRRGAENGCVGTHLVSETDRLRIWHLRLGPGERIPFHCHVNDYFWTVHTSGQVRAYQSDGTSEIVDYSPGMTRHFSFGRGEKLLHSIENTGSGTLVFTTVEFTDGPNEPLTVPDSVRLQPL